MLSAEIQWGTISVSVTLDSSEMDTTVQVCCGVVMWQLWLNLADISVLIILLQCV